MLMSTQGRSFPGVEVVVTVVFTEGREGRKGLKKSTRRVGRYVLTVEFLDYRRGREDKMLNSVWV